MSTFNGIPYCYTTFGLDYKKMFIGLTHGGILVQGGQLASIRWILAREHWDFLKCVIQEGCNTLQSLSRV